MTKTFFHREQPFTRHVGLAAFCLFVLMSVGFWTRRLVVPDHDTEWFLGYMALLSAGALFVPTLVAQFPRVRDRATAGIVGFYEFLCVMGLSLSWAGSLGLYFAFSNYDTFVHFVNSMLFTYAVLDLTLRAFPELTKRWWAAWLIVLIIGMAGGVGNELFEWGGDKELGTRMFGKVGVPASLDTEYDLVADAIGVLVGIAAAHRRKGWM